MDMEIDRIEQLEIALQRHVLAMLATEPGIDAKVAERVATATAAKFYVAMIDELED